MGSGTAGESVRIGLGSIGKRAGGRIGRRGCGLGSGKGHLRHTIASASLRPVKRLGDRHRRRPLRFAGQTHARMHPEGAPPPCLGELLTPPYTTRLSICQGVFKSRSVLIYQFMNLRVAPAQTASGPPQTRARPHAGAETAPSPEPQPAPRQGIFLDAVCSQVIRWELPSQDPSQPRCVKLLGGAWLSVRTPRRGTNKRSFRRTDRGSERHARHGPTGFLRGQRPTPGPTPAGQRPTVYNPRPARGPRPAGHLGHGRPWLFPAFQAFRANRLATRDAD